ncbi:MAG: zinc ribbon domain-containing protein [Verrucomicrobiia bacterium]
MLICPKCNYDNELGRIFCHQCGAKLDLDKVKPTSRGGKIIHHRKQRTAGRIVNRVIGIVILVLLIWGIYLICQVPDIQPVKPTNAVLLAADSKRLALEQLLLQKRLFEIEITAAELNAFIDSLGLEKHAGSGFTVVPVTLQVELGDGTLKLNFLGIAKLGDALSKKIFISYTGVPTTEQGHFEFKPIAAAIGQMPIHPKILQSTSLLQNCFGRLLSKLDHEKSLLDQLTSISVDHNHIVLKYQPKGDGKTPTPR